MDISCLLEVDPKFVYLVSYFNSQQLLEFDKSQQALKNFLVLGGPVPIKSLPVENGVRIFRLPDDYGDLQEVANLGGYLAKGLNVTLPIKRRTYENKK